MLTSLQQGLVCATASAITLGLIWRLRKKKSDPLQLEYFNVAPKQTLSDSLTSPVPLSGCDISLKEAFSSVTWIFDIVLDKDKVSLGLSRALFAFPALSGRIRDGKIQDFGGTVPLTIVTKSTEWIWDNSVTSKELEKCGIALGSGFVTPLKPDHPLILARLTLFPASNRSVLSIRVNHGLADGASMARLLRLWSAGCSGEVASLTSPPRFVVPGAAECTKDDLLKKLPDVLARSRLGNLLAMPRAISSQVFASPCEVRIQNVAAFKASLQRHLPAKEWISSFEAIQAAFIVLDYELRGAPKDTRVRVAINLDLRQQNIDAFPKDYIGNSNVFVVADTDAGTIFTNPLQRIAQTAMSFHNSFREKLDEKEKLLQYHTWYNSAQNAPGVLDSCRTKLIPPVFIDEPFMQLANSWCKFDWFDGMDFGSGENPSQLLTGTGITMCAFRTIVPRTSSNDVDIAMRLTPSQIRHLRKLVRDWNLPFEVSASG